MARALGVTEFLAKKFTEFAFTEEWQKAMGLPEINFKMIIYGKPKNGKTEFCIKFAKYLTRFGKVLYNSFEQGHSKSLQDSLRRQNMEDVAGKIIFTHKERYDEMFKRLKKKKSPTIIFIDSLQYIKLTADQFKELTTTFSRKVFIVISHAEGDEPKGGSAKDIEYDVDIMVLVKNFNAEVRSRFGGEADIVIWEEGHQRYLKKISKQKASKQAPKEATSDLFTEQTAEPVTPVPTVPESAISSSEKTEP